MSRSRRARKGAGIEAVIDLQNLRLLEDADRFARCPVMQQP